MYSDKEASGLAINEPIVLAGEAHCWGVHYGHHVLHIFTQESVEQPLVSLLISNKYFISFTINLIMHLLKIGIYNIWNEFKYIKIISYKI